MIELAIFDMDHTVLGIDSDHSWKYFLADEGFAPPAHRDEADRFLDLYKKGRTPIIEFIEFQLSEFAGRSIAEIRTIADKHFEQRVRKLIYLQARNVIDKFNHDEIDTILLTGTNRIIANPIAKSLGVSRLIATEPEIEDGYFTGRIDVKLKKLTSKDEGKTKASIAQDLSQPRVVQLGAFGKYDNAKRLKNMIKNAGYPVEIVAVMSNGKRLHVVRVVRFNSELEAGNVGKKIKAQYGVNCRVLKRPK